MTALVREVAKVHANMETATRAGEFGALVKFILSSGGISKAAFAVEKQGSKVGNLGPKLAAIVEAAGGGVISREVLERQKAAATPTTLASFADYSVIANGFVNSLVNVSAFDTMLSAMVPVPLIGTAGAVSVAATGYSVGEGSAKQVSRMSLTGTQINPQKAHAIVVVTRELAHMAGAQATALIGRELKNAVAITTDAQFITTLISGLSAATSAGSTAESVRADLAGLLRAVTTGAASRLFVITTALICKMWSMLTDQKGVSAFPDLTPQGGSINGITVLVSDGMTAGNVVLADASGIAAASGDLVLQELDQTSFQFDTAPDSPQSASTTMVSLWQTNQIGIRVERFFAAARLRSDAVALCTNSNSYQSGNSPP